MISVLIPIFNHNVLNLVSALQKQFKKAKVEFEIILLDDASDQQYRYKNAKLDFEEGVTYLQNLFNVGRAKVRNILASKAHYPYILFIDCDAAMANDDYIANYIAEIEKHKDESDFIINGGILYRDKKPKASNKYLRWYYGRHREQLSAEVRNKNPYALFTPFNVLMTRSLFPKYEFDESFETYGNEDTILGYALKAANIPIIHIDNGLYHEGIDTNKQYLQKVESAIDNLISFINSGNPIVPNLYRDVKLLKAYESCKKHHCEALLQRYAKRHSERVKERLSKSPSMFWLDMYKLMYLSMHFSKKE